MKAGKKFTNEVRFFVSIGAGQNQLPLIMDAKKLNFNVIGVDNNTTAPGLIYCDLKIQESIEDYKQIYTKLRELLFDGNIYGILSKSYGKAIITASFLNEKFNIPNIPFSAAHDFINKKKTNSILSKEGIKTPQKINLSPKSNLAKIVSDQRPVIVKPVTGHAKTDVKLVTSPDELKRIVSAKKKNPLIVEECISGDEIIAIGIINRGRFYLVDITDKETTPRPYFADILHVSPSRYYHLHEKITAIGQKITDIFHLDTSPLIIELIVDKNEELYLIEAVPEFGGEFLPDIVVPERTGYRFISETIKAITGKGFKIPSRKKVKQYVAVKYIAGTDGRFVSFNPNGPEAIKGIIFSRIFREIGSNVSRPKTNHDRIGVIVARGKTRDSAIGLCHLAEEKYNIRIV